MYRPGDVIMKSEPWAYCVKFKMATEQCYLCLETLDKAKPTRCTGCGFARYCGRICQKADWKNRHQHECKALKEATANTDANVLSAMDDFLLLSKVLIKLPRGEVTDADRACMPPSTKTFDNLVSHEDELAGSVKHHLRYDGLKSLIAKIDKNGAACGSYEDYIRLCGKLQVNSFGNECISAVYLGPAAIDHSCDPNAFVKYEGKTLLVIAARDIPSFDQVRTSYLHSLYTVPSVRRRMLKEHYFFDCECPGCTPGLALSLRHAVKCPSVPCSAAIPPHDTNNLRCPACRADVTDQRRKGETLVNRILEIYRGILEQTAPHEDNLKLAITALREILQGAPGGSAVLSAIRKDKSQVEEDAFLIRTVGALVQLNLPQFRSTKLGAIWERMKNQHGDQQCAKPDRNDLPHLMDVVRAAEPILHPTNFLLGVVHKDISRILQAQGMADWIQYEEKAVLPLMYHVSTMQEDNTLSLHDVFIWKVRQYEEILEQNPTAARVRARMIQDSVLLAREMERFFRVFCGEDSEIYRERLANFCSFFGENFLTINFSHDAETNRVITT